MWDMLLRGGRVLDPASSHDGPADVAVRSGAVAAIGQGLPADAAAEVVDVTGSLVTPGLVDMHTHVFPSATYWGLDPEPVAWRSGVTTWVDAGSAGAYSLEGLRTYVADRVPVRIHGLINVSGLGLVAETGEHHVLDHLNTVDAAAVAARHGDFVRGVKARIDARTVGANGIEPLRRAKTLAAQLDKPLMVHVGYGPPNIAEIVPLLGEGDILTHCASGCPSDLVSDGALTSPAQSALERGVVFDIGHGSGAFDFDVLETELAAGVEPIISTDLHARSVHGPAFDLPTVMMKMLAGGQDVPTVVAGVTTRPARALGLHDVGSLREGSAADIAVFTVENGRFPVVDVHGGVREAPARLTNTATYVAGKRLPPTAAASPPPWVSLSEAQQQAEAERVAAMRAAAAPRLESPDDFPQPFPRAGANR